MSPDGKSPRGGLPWSPGARRAFFAAILAVLALAAFGGSLRAPFVYDDDAFVVQNTAIRSLARAGSFFRDPGTLAGNASLARDNYRPLTTLSFALNYAAGALNPFGYHLVNVLLHLLAAWLLLAYIEDLLKRAGTESARAGPAAFLAAALFLVHPAQTESVVWVSGRGNLLCAVFMLGALLSRRRGAGGRAASWALAAAALLSKEFGVVLPAAVFLEEALFGAPGGRRALTRAAAEAAPYCALTAAYTGLRFFLLGHAAQTGWWGGSFVLTQLTMARAWTTYARLLVWPHPLSLEYLFPVERHVLSLNVLGAAALLSMGAATAWRQRRRRPGLAFGLGLAFASLIPVANLIPIKAIMAERFLYLPIAGLALALAEAWARARRGGGAWAAAAAVLALGAFLSARRGAVWNDPQRLIEATLATCPQSARMHYGLGRVYASRGRYAQAAEQFRLALAIDPSYEEAARDVGRAVHDAGLNAEQLRAYRATLQTRLSQPDALFELGTAALKAGETDMAVEALRRAAILAPERVDVASNLSAALARAGNIQAAADAARRILRAHPSEEKARRNLEIYEDALARAAAARLSEDFPAYARRFPGEEGEPEAVRRARASLARRAGERSPRFSYADADGGLSITLDSATVAMTPLYGDGRSRGRRVGGYWVYPQAAPGLDVLYARDPAAAEKLYLLSRPPSAPLRYRLTLGGAASGLRREGGALIVTRRRPDGAELTLTAPVVVDRDGRVAPARYELAGAGAGAWTLTLAFQSRGLRYPVLIDPAWTVAGAGTLPTAVDYETLTQLPDGRVLAAGGYNGAAAVATATLYDPLAGTWTATGPMSSARYQHTATLLFNGQVLVVGGTGAAALSTAELYDPTSGLWSPAASLPGARKEHTATLLNDGRVLVAGGNSGAAALNTGEVYNPALNTWTVVGNTLTTAVQNATASLLPSGRVLIAGGSNTAGAAQAQARIYDPSTNLFAAAANMHAAAYSQVSARLPSGFVMVVGGRTATGVLPNSEYYNEATNTWTNRRNITTARQLAAAAVLPDGTLVVAGGWTNIGATAATNTVYVYTPASNTWAAQGVLSVARGAGAGLLLSNGKFLVAGGYTGAAVSKVVDLLDLQAGTFAATAGTMTDNRYAHTASLLPTGQVLVVGGIDLTGNAVNTAELYDPVAQTWTATGSMAFARVGHTASILPNGDVLIAGGAATLAGPPIANCEVYISSMCVFQATGSMNQARFIQTSTLLNSGKILVTGGSPDGATVMNSAELYDPNTGQWTTTGSMNVARANHSAAILPDGRVVIAGGQSVLYGAGLSSAEIYHPNTGTFTMTANNMSIARGNLEAILLASGKVLAMGGSQSGANATASVDIYDSATNAWTATGAMTTSRQQPTGTLLPNGKVLASGGEDTGAAVLSSAELYDPASATWSTTNSMTTTRINQTATLLPDGQILEAGGVDATFTPLNSAETALYTEYNYPAVTPSNQPTISAVGGISPPATINLTPGQTYTITGSSFTGVSDAAGGTQASGANLPRLIARGDDTGTTPPQEQSAQFVDLSTYVYVNALSSTTMTLTIPTSIGYGHYQLFVISNGVPSNGAAVGIFPQPPTLAPTAAVPPFSLPPDDVSLIVDFTPTGELGVNSYLIEVSTSPTFAGPDFFGSGLGAAASSGSVTGLLSNTTYYARVAAESAGGQGPYSATLGSTSTLSVPVVSTSFINVGLSSVTVGWAALPPAPQEQTAEQYVLIASTSPTFSGPILSSATAAMAQSTLTVTGLSANTAYYFEVETLNWNGVADVSVVGPATTPPVPPAPAAPPFTLVGRSSFTVNWDSGTAALGYNGPGTTYAVQVSSLPTFGGAVFSTSTTNLSAPLPGLMPNTTYFAEVGVLVGVTTKSYVLDGSTSTLALAPAPIFSAVNFASATVTWAPYALSPSSMSDEGFVLLASTDTGFTGTVLSSASAAPTISSLTVSGLSAGSLYYFALESLNWNGAPDPATISTVTLPVPPGPAAAPFTLVLASSFTVNWDSGTAVLGYNGPGTTYAVQVSSLPAFGGAVFSTSTTNLSAPLAGLMSNTTYFAEVGVLIGGSTRSYTLDGSTSTLALPPSAAVSATYFSSATVSWAAYPAAPSSVTAEGFVLYVSTTANFSSVISVSSTSAPSATALSASGLLGATTYYLEVASLNWNSAPDFAVAGSTNIAPIYALSLSTNVISVNMTVPNQVNVLSSDTVTNLGNIGTTVQLSLTDPTVWVATSAVPGPDQFRLTGIFTGATPPSGSFNPSADLISTSSQTASTSTYALSGDPASVQGFNLAPGTTRLLFLRIELPPTTSTTTQSIFLQANPGP